MSNLSTRGGTNGAKAWNAPPVKTAWLGRLAEAVGRFRAARALLLPGLLRVGGLDARSEAVQ